MAQDLIDSSRTSSTKLASESRFSGGTFVLAFGLSLAVGIACRLAAGPSLGLYFGPVLLVTVFVPQLALIRKTPRAPIYISAAAGLGIGGVWLVASDDSVLNVMRCLLVLFAYVFALAQASNMLSHARVHPTVAAALISVVGFAWLTWPVWLSHSLSGHGGEIAIAWLTPAHPLLAINGVLLEHFDFWDRYRIAYQQLTTLNQDMPYSLPRSIVPAVFFHCFVGVLPWGAAKLSFARKKAQMTPAV